MIKRPLDLSACERRMLREALEWSKEEVEGALALLHKRHPTSLQNTAFRQWLIDAADLLIRIELTDTIKVKDVA